MSAASLIATHMNAPYGRIVSERDVVTSMQCGRLSASNKASNAILAALFIEVAPDLILRCAKQEQVTLQALEQLYKETLSLGLVPVPDWEKAVGAIS